VTSVGGAGKVAAAGLVIGLVLCVRLLAVNEWDPSAFAAFGEEEPLTLGYAQEKLDREVITRRAQGHDGKFFFVQANDPWILAPVENASVLDRPVYRSQRMFYPALAGGLGFFPPGATIWALIAVNAVFLSVGSWAVARIAEHHHLTPWLGLAFVLNIGVVSELFIDGAGIVAFALACLGALALEEEKPWPAVLFLTASVLTREVMLAFVGMIGLICLARRKRIPWILGIPAVAAAMWAVYIRLRIDLPAGTAQVRELTFVPFSGVVEALTSGRAELVDYLMILVFLMLMVVIPYRAWKSDVYLTWGSVGFVVIAPFLTIFVWQRSFDISRALAPLATAFVIEFALARRRRLEAVAVA
jgi:hypothetical protein